MIEELGSMAAGITTPFILIALLIFGAHWGVIAWEAIETRFRAVAAPQQHTKGEP